MRFLPKNRPGDIPRSCRAGYLTAGNNVFRAGKMCGPIGIVPPSIRAVITWSAKCESSGIISKEEAHLKRESWKSLICFVGRRGINAAIAAVVYE